MPHEGLSSLLGSSSYTERQEAEAEAEAEAGMIGWKGAQTWKAPPQWRPVLYNPSIPPLRLPQSISGFPANSLR
ncbi:hypothetical protein HYQ46_001653 [Verticillium longisporum]|nr:hypothetical protein HYQ46_001653 [Verticillium longisporum]